MDMFSYSTKVKISLPVLEEIIPQLKRNYEAVGNRNSTEGRSLFSTWNNVQKFYERINTLDSDRNPVLQVIGSAKGGTTRIYFKPSVTSMPKIFRKAVIPLCNKDVFIYTDFKAAEFFMNCVFAGENEAVDAYHRGEDIYMHYAYVFPENTPRTVIKQSLIGYLYGISSYRLAKNLGISDVQAERLLRLINQKLPNLTNFKRRIISYDLKHKGYFCPNGFDQGDLIKVADIDPVKGFSENYALSAYTQSALGCFVQSLITRLRPKVNGTLLSVFDSLLIEVHPSKVEELKSLLAEEVSPFRYSDFSVGDSFYDAAYSD